MASYYGAELSAGLLQLARLDTHHISRVLCILGRIYNQVNCG
jgi:hypothetical protein